jgi:uncharacterized protein
MRNILKDIHLIMLMNIFYLIFAMFVIFFLQMIFPFFTEMFYFDPSVAIIEPWRFLTSMFLHGGHMHLLFNMFALFLFGTILERNVGKHEFFKIFLAGGIIGSLIYYLTIVIGLASPIPALGASGGVFAILGALAILTPNLTIFMFFIPMKMKNAAIIWILLEFFGMFNTMSGIASAAHLGGLIFGLLYAKHLKKKVYEPEFYEPDYYEPSNF